MLASIRVVIANALAAASLCIHAAPITHEFMVVETGGPRTGVAATGALSFDDSIVLPATSIDMVNLLTDLDFTWNGVHYDETTANSGRLAFDVNGTLVAAVFGNDCSAGTCVILAGMEQWFVNFPFRFSYSVEGTSDIFEGIVRFSHLSVSEPASLALVCVALAVAAMVSKRRGPPAREERGVRLSQRNNKR